MYHFIVNPGSRSAHSSGHWETIETEIKKRGISYCSYLTDHAGHATEYAAQIEAEYLSTEKSFPLRIVVVGGDGTLNEVVNGLHSFSRIVLGLIPVGSGNDFAREFGISKNPLTALDHVLNPKHIDSMDIGVLESKHLDSPKHFLISSGIGYDAAVCDAVNRSKLKKLLNVLHLGQLSYLVFALRLFFRSAPLDSSLCIDGKTIHKKLLMASSMNCKCEGGGLRLAPTAKTKDHKLTVCVVESFAKWKFFYLLPSLLFGKHTLFRQVSLHHCSTFELTCDAPANTHTDGEDVGLLTHMRVSCHKEQLRIMY